MNTQTFPYPLMDSAMMVPAQHNVKTKVARKKRQSKTSPRKKKWTKPAGKPKRPLSAYNLFFQHERGQLMKAIEAQRNRPLGSDGLGIGFGNLARHIAEQWKHLDDQTRCIYDAAAKEEKRKYQFAVDEWRQQDEKKKKELLKETSTDSSSDNCENVVDPCLVTSNEDSEQDKTMNLENELTELNNKTDGNEDCILFDENHDVSERNSELEDVFSLEAAMPTNAAEDVTGVFDELDETSDTLDNLTDELLAKNSYEECFDFMSNYSAPAMTGAELAPKEQQRDGELMHMLSSLQQLHANLEQQFVDLASNILQP